MPTIRCAHRFGSIVLLLGSLGGTSWRVEAQLVNPSAAALGMGENYTATGRGFGAISWNPAGLAMPDNPGFSMAILPARVLAGLGPIGLSDFSETEGEIVPDGVKGEWLERIVSAGGEDGLAGFDLTFLSLQAGRFGVQLSSTGRMVATLGPGAAELILFGNAGRTGEPGDFALEGSSFDVAVVTTAGISYAQPIIRERGRALAIGVTLKQSIGNGMISGMDDGSQASADPLAVNVAFPLIHSDTTTDGSGLDSGRGYSLDLGATWESGPLTAGVAMRNVVNTFEWDVEKLLYRPGTATAEGGDEETVSDFDAQPFANAPQAVQDRLDNLGFAPVLAVGAGYRVHSKVLVTGEARNRFGDSLLGGPKSHYGVGAEIAPVHWFPLRVGAAAVTGGHLLSAGAGLRLGPLWLGAAVTQTASEFGEGTSAMFTLSSGSF